MLLEPISHVSRALDERDPHPLHPPINGWRDALARFRYDASIHGWRRLRDESIRLGCPPALWNSLYARTILQRGIFQAALLAVLEEPASRHETVLAEIAEAVCVATTPPPHSPARLPGDFEHRLALADVRSSPRSAADLCIGIARAYVDITQNQGEARARHDSCGAADEALETGRIAARAGRHADLLRHTAHAGALAMLGDDIWDGWLREGPAQFQACCAVLMTCLDWLHILGITPKISPDAVRTAMSTRHSQPSRHDRALSKHAPLDLEDLLTHISVIVQHGALPSWHPAACDDEMRMRLSEGVLSLCHARADFAAFGSPDSVAVDAIDDEQVHAAMAQLEADCIVTLGHLRYDAPDALNTLLHRAVDADLHPAVGEAAVWALQQIGTPSLPLARATMRYASDPYARRQASLIYGGAGRNAPAVFDELAAQFEALDWQHGRAELALPLALTTDPRCTPLLIAALRNSPPSASDVTAILDALDQLDVVWHRVVEINGIELPHFGSIADLPGFSDAHAR